MPNKNQANEGKGMAKSFGIKRTIFLALVLAVAICCWISPRSAGATGLKPQVFAVSPVLSAQVLSLLNNPGMSGAGGTLLVDLPARKPQFLKDREGRDVASQTVVALHAPGEEPASIGAYPTTGPTTGEVVQDSDPTVSNQHLEVSSSEATDYANQSAALFLPDAGEDIHLLGSEEGEGAGTEGGSDGEQVAALRPPRLNEDFGGSSLWERNAVPVSVPPGAPVVAIVLDDLGLNRRGTWRAIDLPAPMTLAFMTYARGLDEMASQASRNGHELMLHFPMEPRGPGFNPGPKALRVGLDRAELKERLNWGLARFDGFVGVNNHMGSRFTAWTPGMNLVMRALKSRGLLFLDSVTTGASVGGDVAMRHQVPHARRDIFLDNEFEDIASIRRQLARTEALARRKGFAVAIGHPHATTLKALEQWYPAAQARGIYLVPISEIVRRQMRPPRDVAALTGNPG